MKPAASCNHINICINSYLMTFCQRGVVKKKKRKREGDSRLSFQQFLRVLQVGEEMNSGCCCWLRKKGRVCQVEGWGKKVVEPFLLCYNFLERLRRVWNRS